MIIVLFDNVNKWRHSFNKCKIDWMIWWIQHVEQMGNYFTVISYHPTSILTMQTCNLFTDFEPLLTPVL